MESECLLPYSQTLATCLYTEQDQSNPCLPIQILEDTFHYHPYTITEIKKIKLTNIVYLLNVPRTAWLI